MTEDIQLTVETAGVELTFASSSIFGIPSYLIETLYNGTYKLEKQDFKFIISSSDCLENNIKQGDTFTFEDITYIYTFKITNDPVSDLTGYTTLTCEYVTKVAA